jgi:hypothetical protein
MGALNEKLQVCCVSNGNYCCCCNECRFFRYPKHVLQWQTFFFLSRKSILLNLLYVNGNKFTVHIFRVFIIGFCDDSVLILLYSCNFPFSLGQDCRIDGDVVSVFLFPVYSSPCPLLSVILSQLFSASWSSLNFWSPRFFFGAEDGC